tara:strand:+ start:4502 stop:4936 length:435 start_codon:yes stop_codon:yes gene_type:complete
MGIVLQRLNRIVVLLLCCVLTAPVIVYPLQIQDDSGEGLDKALYVIVVAEAPDEQTAQMMALIIREIVQHPVHLYRDDNKIMIILTGYPIPLADAEIIGNDLKHLDFFQDTPYPRFHPVQSIDYCDQTQRCFDIADPNQSHPIA